MLFFLFFWKRKKPDTHRSDSFAVAVLLLLLPFPFFELPPPRGYDLVNNLVKIGDGPFERVFSSAAAPGEPFRQELQDQLRPGAAASPQNARGGEAGKSRVDRGGDPGALAVVEPGAEQGRGDDPERQGVEVGVEVAGLLRRRRRRRRRRKSRRGRGGRQRLAFTSSAPPVPARRLLGLPRHRRPVRLHRRPPERRRGQGPLPPP